MQKTLSILFILISVCSSCSKKLVPTELGNPNSLLSNTEKDIIKDLNGSVEKIVNSGGNLKRGKAIVKRAKEFGLFERTVSENIDWLSFQKNVMIEIKGKTDSLVYIVSHYDKTDVNPLLLPNILLNGVLDPLISWSYTSDGALDNATGVAVSLQLAKIISESNLKYTYRVLLVGAEESGLRGSRAHVARMSDNIAKKIRYMINMDVVGVKDKSNCVYTNVSNDKLSSISLEAAKELDIELGVGRMPALGCSDYASFQKTSFLTDFGRSLKFNLIGAFIPQRSYFTKKKQTEVINFSSCNLLDAGDYIGGVIFMPIGSIHGFRDTIKLVDEKKLYEQYLLTLHLIRKVELSGGTNLALLEK